MASDPHEDLLRRCARWRRWFSIATLSLPVAIALLFWTANRTGSHVALPFMVLGALALPAAAIAFLTCSVRGRALARRVAAIDDSRALGPLIDSLVVGSECHSEVRTALTRHLATLTPDGAPALGRGRTKRLRLELAEPQRVRMLRPEQGAYLSAVIHALTVCGDTQAIPHIERIMARTDHAGLRARAARAAAQLARLRDDAQASGTLLRPADGAAEELLRPAGGADGAETLLRASEHEVAEQTARTTHD